MFDKVKQRWQSLDITYRFYVLGLPILTFWFFTYSIEPFNRFRNGLILAGAVTFSVGFLFWVIPWLKIRWTTKKGKWIISILHAALLFIAIVPSRILVADAIGLPPQDFEMTVATIAILIYLPLWVVLVAVLTLAVGLLFFLLSAPLLMLVAMLGPFDEFLKLLPRFHLVIKPKWNLAHGFAWKFYFHAFGAFMICGSAWMACDEIKRWISNQTLIKWVAYVSDFQCATNYPGIDREKRLRLHENGVVSYAEQDGWDIKITVDSVKEQHGSSLEKTLQRTAGETCVK